MGNIYLIFAIICEVFATSFLRAAQGFTQPLPSLFVVIGYASSLFLLSLALQTIPVGIAYAVWSGVGIVAISLIGYFVSGQTLDLPALLGIGLIIAGVLIINIFSQSSAH